MRTFLFSFAVQGHGPAQFVSFDADVRAPVTADVLAKAKAGMAARLGVDVAAVIPPAVSELGA